MDIKVSQKDRMYQPDGVVDVIVDGIFDFFLIEHTDEFGQKWIDDIEGIDDFFEEEKDRTVFAVLRQKGLDPMNIYEGVQWSETMMSEIPVPLLLQQIVDAAARESDYVNVSFETIIVGGQEQLSIRFNLVDTEKTIRELGNV